MTKKKGGPGRTSQQPTSPSKATPIVRARPNLSAAPASMSFYGPGLEVDTGQRCFRKPDGTGGVRGEIQGFSKASRRRMRQFMLKHRPPEDWMSFGVTLTIPGPLMSPEEVRALWNRFQVSSRREGWVMIWRREVQKRKADHWHLLLSMNPPHPADIGIDWQKALAASGVVEHNGCTATRDCLPGAWEHSCDVKSNDGTGGWLRYLQDHCTKSKREQVPSDGRQWGVIGKAAYRVVGAELVEDLTDEQFQRVLRRVRMMMRPRVRCPGCVFGSRLGFAPGRGWKGRTVWFMEPSKQEAVKRLIAWVRES